MLKCSCNKNDIIEFSKIYKRVMDIELCLKMSFINAMSIAAKDKKFFRLIPAFKDLKIIEISKYNYKKRTKNGKIETRNRLNDIINSSKQDNEKFIDFINIAYLSDILNLISKHSLIYKNPLFNNNFYTKTCSLNDVKAHSSKLSKLRNVIMHFDIDTYKNNKLEYIKTLAFWETQLHCKNYFIHDLPKVTPTIKNILKLIVKYYPEIFETKDREIVDVFDDIAIINGLPIEKLPQYWSIGRQIYSMKVNNSNII